MTQQLKLAYTQEFFQFKRLLDGICHLLLCHPECLCKLTLPSCCTLLLWTVELFMKGAWNNSLNALWALLVCLSSPPNTCTIHSWIFTCVIKVKFELSMACLVYWTCPETIAFRGQHLIQGMFPFVQEMHLVSRRHNPLLHSTVRTPIIFKTNKIVGEL